MRSVIVFCLFMLIAGCDVHHPKVRCEEETPVHDMSDSVALLRTISDYTRIGDSLFSADRSNKHDHSDTLEYFCAHDQCYYVIETERNGFRYVNFYAESDSGSILELPTCLYTQERNISTAMGGRCMVSHDTVFYYTWEKRKELSDPNKEINSSTLTKAVYRISRSGKFVRIQLVETSSERSKLWKELYPLLQGWEPAI